MPVEMKHKELTDRIIGAYYKVYNTLGYGFLEKVYERAFLVELKSCKLSAVAQSPVTVYYDDHEVGEYFADVIVENRIIIELKAAESICDEHRYQLMNYLKATGFEVGLLLNFGKKPEFKRIVCSTPQKALIFTDPQNSSPSPHPSSEDTHV